MRRKVDNRRGGKAEFKQEQEEICVKITEEQTEVIQ